MYLKKKMRKWKQIIKIYYELIILINNAAVLFNKKKYWKKL